MQKKNKKQSLIEAVAQSMGKGVIDMTGKTDHVSGKGSQIPNPVEIGVPVTQAYDGVQHGLAGIPVTSVYRQALDKGVSLKEIEAGIAAARGIEHRGEEREEHEEETEGHEEAEETSEEEKEVQESFRNAITALLGEEVDGSLVNQLEAVFEAAVTDRVEKRLANILVELDEGVSSQLNTITEALVDKVDDYLDYVVEEWMTENAVAVEQGIKTQIAENFISGLKNLFENHYIDVPNEKYNVLDELYSQNRELETKLNSSINENINLRKEVSLTECAGIFVAETRDLADTQIAKLQNLMENVQFGTPEEYREKLVAIKENYMTGTKVAPTRVVDAVDTFSKPFSAPTTLVEGYANVLGRMNKKV
jgi:hypothetical protein